MIDKTTIQKEKQLALENIKKHIEDLKIGCKNISTSAQTHFSYELENLEKKWEVAKLNLDNFGKVADRKMDEVTTTFETAWEDLNEYFKKVLDTFKEEGFTFSETTWEFYQDHADQWRWRRLDSDSRIVGSSHKGFSNRCECTANASRYGYEG